VALFVQLREKQIHPTTLAQVGKILVLLQTDPDNRSSILFTSSGVVLDAILQQIHFWLREFDPIFGGNPVLLETNQIAIR